jgi:hypothetical protein
MGASIYLGKVLSAGTKGCNIILPNAPSFDPDAQAFITAAGITDATQKTAINTLVVDLKGYSIWSKMKALYPFVGGDATKHSWNLKNTAQFQISWIGGVTHSSNGVQFGGVNGYGTTGYNLATNNTGTDISAGTYSRTNISVNSASLGAVNAAFIGLQLTIKWTDNNTYYAANDFVGNGAGNFYSDTRGYFVVTRLNSTTKVIYRNGIQTATQGGTVNVLPNLNVVLGARNENGSINSYDSRQHAFDFIGDNLTATDVANFYTAVQAFQVSLSRNI